MQIIWIWHVLRAENVPCFPIFNIRSDIRRDTVIWQTDWAGQQGSTSGTNSCRINNKYTRHKAQKGLLEQSYSSLQCMWLPKSTLLRLRLKAIREVKLTVDGREFHTLWNAVKLQTDSHVFVSSPQTHYSSGLILSSVSEMKKKCGICPNPSPPKSCLSLCPWRWCIVVSLVCQC